MDPQPIPTRSDGWLAEIVRSMQAAEQVALARDLDPEDEDHEWFLCVAEEAVRLARAARGIEEPFADPDASMDEVTDLTVELRRQAPGDPDNHHINELQHFLLYYLAAHVHADLLPAMAAGAVVHACWLAPVPGADDEDDGDAAEVWPIANPPPDSVQAWIDELLEVWPSCQPAAAPAGKPQRKLLEAAVAAALAQRGVTAKQTATEELVTVISGMEADLRREGPEVERLTRFAPAAFAIYYLWTHIAIGHADEDLAMTVVQAIGSQLDEFET